VDAVLLSGCGVPDNTNHITCTSPVPVTTGQTLGSVGGTAFGRDNRRNAHLHFELKTFSALGTANGEFGYTLSHPERSGYYDPIVNLHSTTDLVSPIGVTVKTKPFTLLRVGPGGNGSSSYRHFTSIPFGTMLNAVRASRATTSPKCAGGWYQIVRVDGTRFNDGKSTGEIPEGWICRDALQ